MNTLLKELKEEGLIKNIGVTNFDSYHLQIALASGIPIVSNQISHSIIDRRALGAMKEVCDHYKVNLFAYGTLLGGFLSDRWLGVEEPQMEGLNTWSQMKYIRFIKASGGWKLFQELLETLNKVAQKHKTSIANISSRYVLENPNVAAVIIGARLGENSHIKAHTELLNITFEEGDIQALEKVISKQAWGVLTASENIILFVDGTRGICQNTQYIIQAIQKGKEEEGKKAIAVITKVDLTSAQKKLELAKELDETAAFEEIYMISSRSGAGMENLMHYFKSIATLEDVSELSFDDARDDKKNFMSEITREIIFENLAKELPYSCNVVTNSIKEDCTKIA